MQLEQTMTSIGLVNYAVAAVLYLQAHQSGRSGRSARAIALVLCVLATVGLVWAVICQPWGGSDLIAIVKAKPGLFLATAIGCSALLVRFTQGREVPTLILVSLATLFLMIQSLLGFLPGARPGAASTNAITFHIVASVMGQFFGVSATIVSFLYLWQKYLLKRKLLSLLPRLPALDVLERILFHCLWAGFLCLTAALLSGAFYSQYFAAIFSQEMVLKTAWAIAVWTWYLIMLISRNALGIATRRIAQMSFAGFFLLAITFFGLIFFRTGE